MNALRPALVAALLLGACGWDEKASGPSDPRRGGGGPRAPQAVQPAAPPRPATAAPLPLQQPAGQHPSMFKPAEAAAEKPETEEQPRDYPAELLSALGAPVDCLKPRSGPDAPPLIRVDLEAHVLESGLVTRAYARSSQLEETELDCIRRRLGSLHLPAPVEAAPRGINATLELKLKAKTSEKSGP